MALRKAATFLFILSIPIALITTNIRAAVNEPHLYDFSIDQYNGAIVSGIPATELKAANRQLISYFNDNEQRAISIVVTDNEGDDISLFKPHETIHLSDVKDLLKKVFAIQTGAVIFALVFVASAVIWAGEATARTLAHSLLRASGLTIAVIVLAAIAAVAGFDDIWNRFHLLAFTNDFWQLSPSSDHLIQMFPERFWQLAILVICAFTILEALVLGAIAGVYIHYSRRSSQDVNNDISHPAPEA